MNSPTIETLQDKIAELMTVNEAQNQALAKRKQDIDKLTAELEAANKTISEQQVKVKWLKSIASMAVMYMRTNADGHDVEYSCDDILSDIWSMR